MRHRHHCLVLSLLTAILICSTSLSAAPTPETDEQKTLYALGFAISQRLGDADFDAAEVDMIKLGLGDGVLGHESKVVLETYGPKIDVLLKERIAGATAKEKEESQAYLATMGKTAGAQTAESGMIFIETEAGTGASPAPTDTVKLHYHGTLRDGTVFDSSVDRGEPASFRLDSVIPCFSEGVQKMKVGGKAKLVCPSDIAYGDRGMPPAIRPGATLTFDLTLLDVSGGAGVAETVP